MTKQLTFSATAAALAMAAFAAISGLGGLSTDGPARTAGHAPLADVLAAR